MPGAAHQGAQSIDSTELENIQIINRALSTELEHIQIINGALSID